MAKGRILTGAVCVFLTLLSTQSFAVFVDAELAKVVGGSIDSSRDISLWDEEYPRDFLTDNNMQTSLIMKGDGPCINSNGSLVSYGGFIILEFQTDQTAAEIFLDIKARPFQTPDQPGGNYLGMTADGTFESVYSAYSEGIQTINGYFNVSGNNFINEGFGDYQTHNQWQTIDYIRHPDNSYQFLIWGPYLESSYEAGNRGIEIYEAHMTYLSIPEPCTILLVCLGGLLIRKR